MRLRRAFTFCLVLAVVGPPAIAQDAPSNGPTPAPPRWHAFVGARIVTEPGKSLADAMLVCRDGIIVEVRQGATPPAGARVHDCRGLTLYPAFIEPYLPIPVAAPVAGAAGAHWHPAILAQRSALDAAGIATKDAETLLRLGFGAAAISPDNGILRGRGAVVLVRNERQAAVVVEPIVKRHAFHAVAFETGAGDQHPASQMGAIATIRQALLDARWHGLRLRAAGNRPATIQANHALEVLDQQDQLPLLFALNQDQEQLRAAKIAAEAGRPCILLGNGTEYRRLQAFVTAAAPLILTLDYPKTPDVQDVESAYAVSLRQLMAWEQAATNPVRIRRAGIRAALSSHRLADRSVFHERLRQAIRQGLTADDALAMLTTEPAVMLGVAQQLGRLTPGMLANMLIVRGDLFGEQSTIVDVVVAGERHSTGPLAPPDFAGTWTVSNGGEVVGSLRIDRKRRDHTATWTDRNKKDYRLDSFECRHNRLNFVLDGKALEVAGRLRLSATIQGDRLEGGGSDSSDSAYDWTAVRATAAAQPKKDEQPQPVDLSLPMPVPFGAYGAATMPAQADLAILGVTLWTSAPAGRINNGVLIVQRGKITYAGPAKDAPDLDTIAGLRVLDLRGFHVTPGLIDCHSHTGIRGGVNEGRQAVTAEVRIQDVLDADDVNFYRQLAGGVTIVNQLHGSANPIGGQNNVIKLRWGVPDPDQMRLEGAPSGIKFALGENVKQSNWGDSHKTRYPQTRMGVETLIRERFVAAREWRQATSRYETALRQDPAAVNILPPPRLDLELSALAEILAGQRLVHCHSYRQDEILMLCRIAKEFSFRIGTFQHVLEGYKVADAIRAAALGASAFSDWWAYKIEVFDAIPDNGAIMHDAGVVVSFNSDSNDFARRLNTEAAKAIKYGNLPPERALEFVTLNPAIQLGIADRVGSLQAGKDGDFVVWNGNPLSNYTRCVATYIDGRPMFSLQGDEQMRQRDTKERQRLIQRALASPRERELSDKGKPGADKPGGVATQRWHLLEQLRRRQRGLEAEGCNCMENGTER